MGLLVVRGLGLGIFGIRVDFLSGVQGGFFEEKATWHRASDLQQIRKCYKPKMERIPPQAPGVEPADAP
jgi:hypothetical protein